MPEVAHTISTRSEVESKFIVACSSLGGELEVVKNPPGLPDFTRYTCLFKKKTPKLYGVRVYSDEAYLELYEGEFIFPYGADGRFDIAWDKKFRGEPAKLDRFELRSKSGGYLWLDGMDVKKMELIISNNKKYAKIQLFEK